MARGHWDRAFNPNTLTFDFEPYAVFVFKGQYEVAQTYADTVWNSGAPVTVFPFSLLYFFRGGSYVEVAALSPTGNGQFGQTHTKMPYTMEGNTMSWAYTNLYGETAVRANMQLNAAETVYHYIAIGKGTAE